MYVGALDPASTRAGYFFIREVVDEDTGEAVDLSNAAIELDVRDPDSCSVILSATTANGKITILDTGVFQVAFTATDMRSLCAKTYDVGCTVTLSGEEASQFIIGTLPVLDGIVT